VEVAFGMDVYLLVFILKRRQKLKITSFILTILIQFLSIVVLKLLDDFHLIIMIFIACLAVGLLAKLFNPTNSNIQKIGWGLLFGSLTSLTLTVLFVVWLSFNFPK
jgi:hypothetical protein